MPLNNIPSNAPANMQPYLRELETIIESLRDQVKVLTTQINATNRRV